MRKLLPYSRILMIIASLLMIITFYVPFWEILMWAPQYPEGLSMYIWLYKISGDVDIINGLNHYIGMKHIKVEMFPEFTVMPYIVGGVIAFGLLSAIIGKKIMLWIFFFALIGIGIAGLVDFYLWGYDYGHNLDDTAAIKVPGMVYQPPLIGSKELLNFQAYSGPATGGWVMVASGGILIITLVIEFFKNKNVK